MQLSWHNVYNTQHSTTLWGPRHSMQFGVASFERGHDRPGHVWQVIKEANRELSQELKRSKRQKREASKRKVMINGDSPRIWNAGKNWPTRKHTHIILLVVPGGELILWFIVTALIYDHWRHHLQFSTVPVFHAVWSITAEAVGWRTWNQHSYYTFVPTWRCFHERASNKNAVMISQVVRLFLEVKRNVQQMFRDVNVMKYLVAHWNVSHALMLTQNDGQYERPRWRGS